MEVTPSDVHVVVVCDAGAGRAMATASGAGEPHCRPDRTLPDQPELRAINSGTLIKLQRV